MNDALVSRVLARAKPAVARTEADALQQYGLAEKAEATRRSYRAVFDLFGEVVPRPLGDGAA